MSWWMILLVVLGAMLLLLLLVVVVVAIVKKYATAWCSAYRQTASLMPNSHRGPEMP